MREAALVEVGLADGGAQAVPGLPPGVHAARRLDHSTDRQVAVLQVGDIMSKSAGRQAG
jgi:hypothetical protein